tara:strand:- start:17102 stop:17827 length:726 start_codon:yes stop_codon:yes gene_type:complete
MSIPEKFTCIIPARYESLRFQGKPLADISGKSMICRVYDNAVAATHVGAAIVATDDERIFEHCDMQSVSYVRTSDACPNGSERVAEVARELDDEYIFEMQGDQPLVTPEIIDTFVSQAAQLFKENPDIDVVIPFAAATKEQTESPDVLKVVVAANKQLLFQTRQPIQTGYRTLGLYLWKRDALLRFAELPVSKIEEAEASHPIRLYTNNFIVQGVELEGAEWVEVDREHHIQEVEKILAKK